MDEVLAPDKTKDTIGVTDLVIDRILPWVHYEQ